jgi:hypothetical protein
MKVAFFDTQAAMACHFVSCSWQMKKLLDTSVMFTN